MKKAPPRLALPAWARTKGLGTNAKTDIDRWIREDEVLKLLAAARRGKDRWASLAYDALVLMANLGLRVGEVVTLQPEDFDMLESHQAVNVRTLKKHRNVHVTSRDVAQLTPESLIEFQEKLNARPIRKPVIHSIYLGIQEVRALSPIVRRRIMESKVRRQRLGGKDSRLFPHSKRYIQYLFDQYRAAAGLRVGLSCHALRRFVATRISEVTGNDRLATKRLRHSESVTRGSYVQFSPEKQIALLNRMKPVL